VTVRQRVAICYAGVAVLCLAAPYATASPAMAKALLPYTGGPFALASIALALDAVSRRGYSWLDWLPLASWAAAAVAFSAHLSAPPFEFEALFRAMEVRSILAVVGSAGMLVAALLSGREGTLAQRATRGLSFVGLASLLGWFSLIGMGVLPAGGINEVARGLRATQLVLTGSAAVLVAASLGWRGAGESGRRPTSGCS
jgi:hypothetical protein